MPLERGSLALSRFRLRWPEGGPKDKKAAVISGFRRHPFTPVEPEGERDHSEGFVELRDADASEFKAGTAVFGGYAIAGYRRDRLRVPAALLRRELERFAKSFELKRKRPMTKPELAEQRELLLRSLRQKVAPTSRVTELAIDLEDFRLLVFSASRREAEHVSAQVADALSASLEEVDGGTLFRALAPTAKDPKPTKALFWVERGGRHGEEA